MNQLFVLMTSILIGAIPAAGQEKFKHVDIFENIVRANIHEVHFENRKASGPGIDWLVEEGAKAQYFLIGERHGLAEIPQISASIFKGLAKRGYNYAALEFGPFAAKQVEIHLKKGGYSALEKYLKSPTGYNSVAFLDWVEEAQMAADMFEDSNNNEMFFWGLDQEFFFGFPAHLNFLEKHAQTEVQKKAISVMQDSVESSAGYFINLLPEEMKKFTNLFRSLPSPEVQDLLDALIFSNYVYGPWAKPRRIAGAESNIIREDYMKDNFLKYVKAARARTGKDPKVFFKFGGFHAAPSVDTRNGKITLGTFIEAFARVNGKTAFNLFMECYSGSNRSSGQDTGKEANQKQECGSYFGKVNAEAPVGKERHMFSEFIAGSNEVFLVDLRPIRLRMNEFKFLSDDARELIASFDAYLAIPNTPESVSFEKNE